MAEEVITKWRDGFSLFETKLKTASATLDQRDQIGYEILPTLDSYKLLHPRGVFGLLLNGVRPSKDERIKGNTLVMKEDLIIGVVSIVRFIMVTNAETDKHPMLPMEYPELAINTLSGIEIQNNRPENERRIYPMPTELVDETDGVWKYLTPFVIPRDFIKS